ncbi:MAG TPA: hypothetical protein VG847_14570 [Chitinophagaceae bacterium]|nr:hypothetical protein [Chitinophagaceae bacterium]
MIARDQQGPAPAQNIFVADKNFTAVKTEKNPGGVKQYPVKQKFFLKIFKLL